MKITALASCCGACQREACVVHRLPDLFVIAGQEAGCFPLDALARSSAPAVNGEGDMNPVLLGIAPEPHPGHQLIYDGNYPRLMHLHHQGNPNVLLLSDVNTGKPEIAGDVLSWLEAIHAGWL